MEKISFGRRDEIDVASGLWPDEVEPQARRYNDSAVHSGRILFGTDGGRVTSTQTPCVWLISGCPVGKNAATKISFGWTIGTIGV